MPPINDVIIGLRQRTQRHCFNNRLDAVFFGNGQHFLNVFRLYFRAQFNLHTPNLQQVQNHLQFFFVR